MAKVSFASVENAPIIAPPAGSAGSLESRALIDRDRDPIHVHVHRLDAGASVRFTGTSADHLIFIWHGGVAAGETRLPTGSSAVVEYGASLDATAEAGGATIIEFHMRERGAESLSGGHVHLLPNERVPHHHTFHLGKNIDMALHADARASSFRAWLHESRFDGDFEAVLHSHTEDEVIFVTGGAMRVGNRLYGPGTALAVAADVKYGFFSGPEGLHFINFRGATPIYRTADGSREFDEAEFWYATQNGGKPDYLTL